MKKMLYSLIGILWITACQEDSEGPNYTVRVRPHNSNEELYAGLPVKFESRPKDSRQRPVNYEMELYVDGTRVETDLFQNYTFAEPGTYEIRVLVKSANSVYELDSVLHVAQAPPVFGAAQRGEKLLFGWKAGSSYKALLGTSHGSSVLDYEVLSLDASMEQQGSLTEFDLGWYPEVSDHGASPSGWLGLVYDDSFAIYDDLMNLKHRLYFNYGRAPRKVFMGVDKAILLFDSLAHLTLREVSLATGQMTKRSTQFIGVDGMIPYNYFPLDESRTVVYYANQDNSKTLFMGVQSGTQIDFSQYFLPPVFVKQLIPISTGGYISFNFESVNYKISVMGADNSNIVKWIKTFDWNAYSYWNQFFDKPVVLKEVDGFVYVFFDNMRCLKLSIDGQLIWDKYFYPDTSSIGDVIVTPTEEFIMLGTRKFIVNDLIDQQLQTDIITIKINKDGYRVGL